MVDFAAVAARQLAAAYATFGASATWRSKDPSVGAAEVTVIRTRPETGARLAGAGEFRLSPEAQSDAVAFEVRASEISAPTRGDTIEVDDLVYTVREWEVIDDGRAWRVTVGKAEDA